MRLSSWLIVVVVLLVVGINAKPVDPDSGRPVPQIIEAKGYPCETHYVTTDDGFILALHRIPAGHRQHGSVNKYPVLVMHGLLDSSAAWVLNTPEQSLGFLLADAGFDVWMGNNRGNFYSRNHTHFKPFQHKFWAWSYDEMARYDLPAMVNAVIKVTGASKIGYVGHSQGTIQMFSALSLAATDIADKITVFNALAPVAHVGNSTSILINAMAQFNLDFTFTVFGVREFLPSTKWLHQIGQALCAPDARLCEDFIFLLCATGGEPLHSLNGTRFPVYVSHTPAGTSVQNMAHWAQGLRRKRYEMMNFGPLENLKRYNQTKPPRYDLSHIQTPIAFYSGTRDSMADTKDVEYLRHLLPKDVVVHDSIQPKYQHLDYTWGIDTHVDVYRDVIKQLTRFLPS